jgi:hypothetical protein
VPAVDRRGALLRHAVRAQRPPLLVKPSLSLSPSRRVAT